MTKRCQHRWCRQRFEAAADDLLFCPRCRQMLLAKEQSFNGASGGYAKRQWLEAIATTEYWKDWRSPFDYRIIDENGREVWASELIKRYRRETRPRPAFSGKKVRLGKAWQDLAGKGEYLLVAP